MNAEYARATIAITLLEHAAGLLATASSEGPKGENSIEGHVVEINRRIHALQRRLFVVQDREQASSETSGARDV